MAVGGEDMGHLSAQVLEVPWRTVLNTVVNLQEICQRDEQLVIGGAGGGPAGGGGRGGGRGRGGCGGGGRTEKWRALVTR